MSVATAEKTVDAFVAQVDPHAVHRTETRARGRSVDVGDDDGSGMATVFATLFATDAKAFDTRVDALARTVCPADPRTKDQRRADAIGALAHGGGPPGLPLRHRRLPRRREPTLHRGGGLRHRERGHPRRTARATSPPPPPPDARPSPDDERRRATSARGRIASAAARVLDPANERTALDGEPPAMFTKPLRELTLTEALTPTPGRLAQLRPAALMGGQFLPGAIACRATVGATITRDRPPRPSPTRTPIPTVEEAGRLRPLPRHDVPLPRLQSARHEL